MLTLAHQDILRMVALYQGNGRHR